MGYLVLSSFFSLFIIRLLGIVTFHHENILGGNIPPNVLVIAPMAVCSHFSVNDDTLAIDVAFFICHSHGTHIVRLIVSTLGV